jgi:hypothetical protein
LIFDRVVHIFILGKHVPLDHTHESFILCMPSSQLPPFKSIAAHGRQSKIAATSSVPSESGEGSQTTRCLAQRTRERRTETQCIRREKLTRHETQPIIFVAYLLNGEILKIKWKPRASGVSANLDENGTK